MGRSGSSEPVRSFSVTQVKNEAPAVGMQRREGFRGSGCGKRWRWKHQDKTQDASTGHPMDSGAIPLRPGISEEAQILGGGR